MVSFNFSSANAFDLDQSNILSSGKELKLRAAQIMSNKGEKWNAIKYQLFNL